MNMDKKLYYRYEPNDEGSFKIKERMLLGRGINCFLTKEEATLHFEKAERIAEKKYEKVITGIGKLREKLGAFTFVCDAEALDDTGLETSLYIEIRVDGYEFRFKQS